MERFELNIDRYFKRSSLLSAGLTDFLFLLNFVQVYYINRENVLFIWVMASTLAIFAIVDLIWLFWKKKRIFWIGRNFILHENGFELKLKAFKKSYHAWSETDFLKLQRSELIIQLKNNEKIEIPKTNLLYEERKRLESTLFKLRDEGKIVIAAA